MLFRSNSSTGSRFDIGQTPLRAILKSKGLEIPSQAPQSLAPVAMALLCGLLRWLCHGGEVHSRLKLSSESKAPQLMALKSAWTDALENAAEH